MQIRRIAPSVAFAAGLAARPLSAARAQYYYAPCSPSPLAWPFCAAAGIVGTAAIIVTAPFRALAPPPPPYYYPWYRPPYYPPSGYYGPPYYPPPYYGYYAPR